MRIGINLTFIKGDINVGVGLFTIQLVEGLLLNNEKNNIYVIFSSKKTYEQFSDKMVNNINLEFVIVEDIFILNKYISKLIRDFVFLPKLLANHKLDIYINPYVNIFSILNPISNNIAIIHDLHFKYYPEHYPFYVRRFLKWRIGKILYKSDKVITISNYVKKDIEEIYPFIDKNNIYVVGNPVEVPELENVFFNINIEGKYILSVNSFEKWKNHITLLKAFLRIKNKIKHNLILIGYGDVNKIKSFITENNLDNRVKIKQHITDEELYAYYKNASLFVNTSLFEGFGRSNIEAGLMKIPVLTSKEMSLKDVSFGLLNYFEPATNDFILAKRILWCLEENRFSTQYLENIREKFKNEYNKKNIASKILKIISKKI